VRLDDKSQKAAYRALYTTEHYHRDIEFHGKINIVRDLNPDLIGLLLLSLAELRLDRFGRSSIIDLKLEGTEKLEEKLSERWFSLLNELKGWLYENM